MAGHTPTSLIAVECSVVCGMRTASLLFLDDGAGAIILAGGGIMRNTINLCLALNKKLDTPETPDYRLTLALGLQMILFSKRIKCRAADRDLKRMKG